LHDERATNDNQIAHKRALPHPCIGHDENPFRRATTMPAAASLQAAKE
jgi:hypothetical protein